MVFFVCASVEAQTSVTLRGTVSETVALSVAPTFTHGNMEVVSTGGNTVRITLSGTDAEVPVIRVPLLVRSNSGFKVSAVVESQTAVLTDLSVIDVRPTGRLVPPGIVGALIKPKIDLDVSRPLLVLSGPRISLGGTLVSSNNALQVTLLVRMKPQQVNGWMAHLTLVATAGPPIQ